MRRCVICGEVTFGSNWICQRCYKEWELKGKKAAEWPEWIKALLKIERRNERLERLITTYPLIEFE